MSRHTEKVPARTASMLTARLGFVMSSLAF